MNVTGIKASFYSLVLKKRLGLLLEGSVGVEPRSERGERGGLILPAAGERGPEP